MAGSFPMPPELRNEAGDMRRVGFEIEFAGVDLGDLARAVADEYGGEVLQDNAFVHRVVESEFGEFSLEVDAALLKDHRYKRFLDRLGVDLDESVLERLDKALLEAASLAVPFELVTPPIPLDRLEDLTSLEDMLRARQAKGTRASFLYGFGMQFNPELPALDVDTILSHTRAFLLLVDWLKQEISVDLTRRVAPFIDDFPEEYVRLALDPDYAPDLERFMDDYLAHNPTRNRPLDLTCLLAHLDGDRVAKAVEDPHLVKPRPTFHYRLPDCRIDEPEWSMALEWSRWVEVETLAADAGELERLSGEYLERTTRGQAWLETLKEWFAS